MEILLAVLSYLVTVCWVCLVLYGTYVWFHHALDSKSGIYFIFVVLLLTVTNAMGGVPAVVYGIVSFVERKLRSVDHG